jgi:hypothetical protein
MWGWVSLGERKVNRRCHMTDAKMTSRLEMRWVPVVDQRGRKHLEARWVDRSQAAATRVNHAA